MKTLYLVRHAKSSWKDPEQTDIDRPLNKRGQKDAPLMGKVLKKAGAKPDIILSSPANRAITTAQVIAEKLGYPKEDIAEVQAIYGADVGDLLQVIRRIDDAHESAMMFGHNPTFHELAESLTDTTIEKLPTCAVVCVEFDVDSWGKVERKGGARKFMDYPKRHKKE
ncbi:MAG: histidine phosphatase family protein [Planctomycetes bacterium]|nr:histidine phosphatase family protein [Planctomycetota bacterium]